MANNTSSPVAMTARIDLVVDDAQTKRNMDRASRTVKQSLDRIESNAGAQVSANLAQRTQQISSALKTATDQLSSVLKVGLGAGMGAGGSAVAAFLRSNTAEAMRFKSRLSEVQTALGGVGQKLAFNVKFGGKSMYEWAEKLSNYLNNLSTDQLQKAADIVKTIAITLAGLKAFSMGAGLVQGLAGLANALKGGAAAKAAGAAANALSAGAGAGAGAGGVFALKGAKGIGGMSRIDMLNTSKVLGKTLATLPEGTAMSHASIQSSVAAAKAAAGVTQVGQGLFYRLGLVKGAGGGLGGYANAIGLRAGLYNAAIVGAASSFAEYGVKKGYRSYKEEDKWLRGATGSGMWNMNNSEGTGTIQAIWNHGLHTDNWFDRIFRSKNPFASGEIKMDPTELSARIKENLLERQKQVDYEKEMVKYTQFQGSQSSFNNLGMMYGRQDATYTTDQTYADLKPRIAELRKQLKEADSVASTFKTLRDKYEIGTESYTDADQYYQSAMKQGTSAQGMISGIERLGIAEKEEEEKRKERRMEANKLKSEIESDNAEGNAYTTAQRQLADKWYNRNKVSMEEDFEKSLKRTPSLSLGIGVSSMPQFMAQKLQDADTAKTESDSRREDYQKRLVEMGEREAELQEGRDREDAITKKSFLKSIEAIEKVITGTEVGAPVE